MEYQYPFDLKEFRSCQRCLIYTTEVIYCKTDLLFISCGIGPRIIKLHLHAKEHIFEEHLGNFAVLFMRTLLIQ